MPNCALIPRAETRIEALSAVVDGYPEGLHKLSTQTSGAPIERRVGGKVTRVEAVDHATALADRLVLTGWVSNLERRRPARRWRGRTIRRLHREKRVLGSSSRSGPAYAIK